jgi:hypothetical protein
MWPGGISTDPGRRNGLIEIHQHNITGFGRAKRNSRDREKGSNTENNQGTGKKFQNVISVEDL